MDTRALVAVNSSDPLRSGAQGVARGVARARDAAVAVASPAAVAPERYSRAAATLIEARQQVQASAQVVRTADRMIGSLLDVFA
jgi:hypothetical protein